MNDMSTLASTPHQAARPGAPVRLAERSRRHLVEAEIAKPLEQAAANGLLRLLGRLSTLATQWRMQRDRLIIGAEIDDLSEGQLLDVGISRVARRERWLDGSETRLPMDYFEHRIHSDVSRGRDLTL